MASWPVECQLPNRDAKTRWLFCPAVESGRVGGGGRPFGLGGGCQLAAAMLAGTFALGDDATLRPKDVGFLRVSSRGQIDTQRGS